MTNTQSFGNMTDRELLVALYKDVQILNYRVEAIKCPSPMCLSHAQTLSHIEDKLIKIETEDETEDKIHERSKRDRFIMWSLSISVVGLACTVFGMMVG